MKKELASKSAFFTPRVVVSLAFCAIGFLVSVLAFSLYPGGYAFARVPVAENPEAGSGKNPIAEKYDTLVMRVYFRDRAERDRLAQELNPEEVLTTGGYLTIINNRDLYYSLRARGLRVEIDENSSRNLSHPQIQPFTFYGGYKTVEEIYAFLDQKVAQFPGLVEKIDIGDSWCKSHPGSCVLPTPWNGYDLFVLHITNRNIPGPKPVFWADGDIHAREIATPEVVMRMIDYLLNNYDTNADVHWLVDYHDIWLMPEVNPDGHHIVEAGGGGNSPYYYRKNGNNVGGGGCSWPPTAFDHFGVDNNRNFPFHWGCCNGSSGSVCDQTYRGTSPGSDPEDMAIVNEIRTLVPDQRGPGDTDPAPITATGVYQNIHTNARVNLFTWGWTATQIPNYAETRNIAAHMAASNAGGNGYPYGSIIEQLYPVDGGSIDWAYGELGMAAFSTELGGQDFLVPYSCIDNPGCGSSQGLWPENRGMLLYLAKIARTPYLTSHGPDANTVVTDPVTVPQGVPSQLTASITFAWSNNAFSQNVGAAEYYIDTPPWAGGTAIPMNGTFNSPTVAVNATINTASLSTGRHIIFVRGRGVSGFQGFQTWGPISAAFLDVTGTATLQSAVSRKTHGAAGNFDVDLPLTGNPGIECRTGGATNDYAMMVTFSGNVTVAGSPQAQMTSGTGCVGTGGVCMGGNNVIVSGAVVTIPLTNIADDQTINVRLNGVNGAADAPAVDVTIPMRLVVGDTTGDGNVNSSDVAQTKARVPIGINASTFRSDVNANGAINSSDIALIKQNLP